MLVNIKTLINDAICYEIVRQLRWPTGIQCPTCGASEIGKHGMHTQQAHRQRYTCQACGRQFDDLSGTSFEGYHHPLRVWVLCLCFMDLNLSNTQIVNSGVKVGPVRCRARLPNCGRAWWSKRPTRLSGEIEADEVYIVAGQNGYPEFVAQLGRADAGA